MCESTCTCVCFKQTMDLIPQGKNCFFMRLHVGHSFQFNWKMNLETHGTLIIYMPYFENISSKSCTKY